MTRPRILLTVGYFDWFSGYQETVLAAALAQVAHLEILCSDIVAPIFSDDHLEALGMGRRYRAGITEEAGARVHRLRSVQHHRMVWSREARRIIENTPCDLIIQVMPGQGLPLAASLARTQANRVVLYGDNGAMWAHLSARQRRLKWSVFAATRGTTYRYANRRAETSYGYTPETIRRLAPFARKPLQLLPLAFDESRFSFDESLRESTRQAWGYSSHHRVVLAAGKFDRRKRLDLLITAFAQAVNESPDLRLLLVGSDGSSLEKELLELAHELKVDEFLTIRRFLDAETLNAVFNLADVGVWPRQPAITIQQALGTGLAVVLPRTPWVDHLLTSSTGQYVDPDVTAPELARALLDIHAWDLSNRRRSERAVTNARFSGRSAARLIMKNAGLEIDA